MDRYISQSMGHATDKTITERHIAQYPLETMFEYNNKLLDLQPKVTEEDVKNMTEEQNTDAEPFSKKNRALTTFLLPMTKKR